jgi:hypothetical protein
MRKIIITAAAAALLGACSHKDASGGSKIDSVGGAVAPAAPVNPAATPVDADSTASAVVVAVGTHGEDLYDQVKLGDWTKAKATMDSLDASARALKGNENAQIAGVLDTLRGAISGHKRDAALEGSNRVTFVAAALSEPYHPKTPADVVRLDYYGRELEIWAAQKNAKKLAETSADLRRTWEAVKPTVVSAGGAKAAATTDALVIRLAAAKSPADYGKLATPFLDVVEELEKPFEK